MPSSERTKYLFEYSTECFEQWAVDVVGVKIKLMSKAPIMPQQSHMPQPAYGSTSGSMPFGANLCGGNAFGGKGSSQYGNQKHRKLVHKVDKPCTQWSMRGSCSYGSECRFMIALDMSSILTPTTSTAHCSKHSVEYSNKYLVLSLLGSLPGLPVHASE